MPSEIALVTAVTGGYDYVGDQVAIPGVDYLYFTDGKTTPPTPWRVEKLVNDRSLDPRRLAKGPKLNPFMFEVLRQYHYVVWIDGSMQVINPNFVDEILSYMQNGFVISPHFDDRHCAYGEATIRPKKYAKEPLDEQVAAYRAEGFPEEYGLYECGVNAKDMTSPEVEQLCEMWYGENLRYSYQDQVSLPYCLWKTGFKPDVLPKSWRNMDWIHLNAHKSEA